MERWMGLPSGFCKYSSSERRYRAWISCKAELGDTRGVDLRKCLHPVHQRPYSINQIECSTDSNGCAEQITGTAQSTVHPIQQSCVAQLTASARSANESRKMEKTPLGPWELPAFRTALEIHLGCSKKSAFAGSWHYPIKSTQETEDVVWLCSGITAVKLCFRDYHEI